MSQHSSLELIAHVAEQLGPIVDRVTFLGGAVVGLLVSDLQTWKPRVTDDVDVAVELASITDFYKLEEELRSRGFQNVMSGPICRFRHGLSVLDVVPTDPSILGFSNPWYGIAIATASPYRLPNEIIINLISAPCFLATKMEAFNSTTRANHGDLFASYDFEDILTVVDGRPSIAVEVSSAPSELRRYLIDAFAKAREHPYWREAVEDRVQDGRLSVVNQRIDEMGHF